MFHVVVQKMVEISLQSIDKGEILCIASEYFLKHVLKTFCEDFQFNFIYSKLPQL